MCHSKSNFFFILNSQESNLCVLMDLQSSSYAKIISRIGLIQFFNYMWKIISNAEIPPQKMRQVSNREYFFPLYVYLFLYQFFFSSDCVYTQLFLRLSANLTTPVMMMFRYQYISYFPLGARHGNNLFLGLCLKCKLLAIKIARLMKLEHQVLCPVIISKIAIWGE